MPIPTASHVISILYNPKATLSTAYLIPDSITDAGRNWLSSFRPVPLFQITVSSNASGRTVARIARATATDNSTAVPESSAQSIELVDYPTVPRARSHPTQAGLPEYAGEPASRPGKRSFDRLGFADWERGVPREAPGPSPRLVKYWAEALRRRSQFPGDKEEEPKMKFSHSLQFNAVPDWSAYYIAYSNLKKLIYTLEKQAIQLDGASTTDVEAAPLLNNTPHPDTVFRRALDAELEKISSFYQFKEDEILGEVDELVGHAERYLSEASFANVDPMGEALSKTRSISSSSRPRRGSLLQTLGLGTGRRRSGDSGSGVREDAVADSDEDEQSADPHSRRPHSQGTTSMNPDGDTDFLGDTRATRSAHHVDPKISDLHNSGVSLRKRAIDVYVSICGLKSYIQLNKTGFSKALKKYDKTLDRALRREFMNTAVSSAYPFTDQTMERIDTNIAQVERVYADIATSGNLKLAKRELRLHLREHVVWERNTVWREMIGIERKAQAANVGIRRTLLGGDEDPVTAQRQGDEHELKVKELSTPLGRYRVPEWVCSLNFGTLIFILIVFAVMLSLPIMKEPEEQNCLAMLVFVSLLWATEVIPLFVTSLLIPFLVVLLGIMRSEDEPHERLGPKHATDLVFASMWTPVIMLLLGGFTIAAALSKYDIARRMAMFVLSKAGTKPSIVLLTSMFVSMFLSMWISNVASPVLCYSIVQPLLRNLPPDSKFAKALVLGIALAANVGGAASPIASPQNIIALQNMHPSVSWGTWFFIALPVCIISILLIWGLMVATFRPGRGTTIIPIRPVKDKFSGVQYFISIVTITTIGLWCGSHQLEHVFGDMGVIAIIPMVLFFGTGILNKEDFNNFLWTIIILAAGGLCLGKAVTSSGLLNHIASAITEQVHHLSLYGVLITFSAMILVIATFISHTVAALIILPLVRQIGVGMEDPHPNLLVMASALMCSVAMALPTSGFPNMTAIMTEVPQTGQRYLRVQHFFTRGIPSSIMSFIVIVTLGYSLMLVAGL
ncbi:phosphate transporter [Aspergillus sclerotialis]|uniref:Phosphate transporter n=1 Tax=Aspergillus sclerotialis TaxID=2070753 RepID=A0A3A2ZPL9_9EURO|nr:phosphate transporter [Aspergillus sclerotialis]